jgi:hypothetical protein
MNYLGGEVGVELPCKRLKGGAVKQVRPDTWSSIPQYKIFDLPRQRVSTTVPGDVLEGVELVRDLRYGLFSLG